MACALLDRIALRSVVANIDCFLFDLDGVLWNGTDVVPGVPESLALLRNLGKKIGFVTNNASRSRSAVAQRLHKFGYEASESEIFSSAFICAKYLSSQSFSKKIYAIGNQGLRDELEAERLALVPTVDFGHEDILEKGIDVDPDIGAVVVGLDSSFSFNKLVYATVCLRTIPGCTFIATNPDKTFPFRGSQYPGAGSLVAAVACASGHTPIVMGKPEPQMLDVIVSTYGISRDRICMVGDRLDTDILFGRRGNVPTLLVLTGIDNMTTVHESPEDMRPDYALNSFADVAQYMKE